MRRAQPCLTSDCDLHIEVLLLPSCLILDPHTQLGFIGCKELVNSRRKSTGLTVENLRELYENAGAGVTSGCMMMLLAMHPFLLYTYTIPPLDRLIAIIEAVAGGGRMEELQEQRANEPKGATIARRTPAASLDQNSALRNHRIRFHDAIDPNAERVTSVHRLDILLGRGKCFQDHSGNKCMRRIVDKYKEQYHTLKRSHKRGLVEAVYKEVVEGGGRFLATTMSGDGCFVLVNDEVAMQKVNNALRCKRAYNKNIETEIGREGVVSSATNSGGTVSGGATLLSPSSRVSAGGFPQSFGVLPSFANRMALVNSLRRPVNSNAYGLLYRQSLNVPAVPSSIIQTNVGYYNMLHIDQRLRETLLLQQMQDSGLSIAPRVASFVPSLRVTSIDDSDELRRASTHSENNEGG